MRLKYLSSELTVGTEEPKQEHLLAVLPVMWPGSLGSDDEKEITLLLVVVVL